MSSLQSGTVNLLIKLLRRNLFIEKLEAQTHRASFERISSITKFPRHVKYEVDTLAGLSAGWFTPEKLLSDKIIYYLHGGGYFSGSHYSHRALIARLARAASCKAVAINYRLSPENPYPAGLDDAIAGYDALLAMGHKKIVIAGDSAGGGLTLATLLRLKDEKKPLPIGAVLLSPWTDLTISGLSVEANKDKDVLLPSTLLPIFAKKYFGDNDPSLPYISPLFGNFKGFPPVMIQVSDAETILDDSLRLAKKLSDDGVEVDIEVWNDCMHVWQYLGGIMPEANMAISKMGTFIAAL